MTVSLKSGSGGSSSGPSLGGFFRNFFEDARNTVVGIPVGLYNLGQGVVHDTARAATLGAWDPGEDEGFKTDDIAKGIGSYYWNDSPIGALLQGDLGGAADRAYKNPFSTALDAFSVASLGASAATKAGLMAKPSSRITVQAPHTGLTLEKRLSPNPLSAKAQTAYLNYKVQKAANDPNSRAAQSLSKQAKAQTLRRAAREADRIAADAKRISTEFRSKHGDLADDAGTLLLDQMTPDRLVDGYRNVLAGTQLAHFRSVADKADAAFKKLTADRDLAVRQGTTPEVLDDLDTRIAVAKTEADAARETAKRYDLSPAARETMLARIEHLERHKTDLEKIMYSPEAGAYHEAAKQLGQASEDLYLGSHIVAGADDALREAARKSVEANRVREWSILYPDQKPPDIALENAVFRSHSKPDLPDEFGGNTYRNTRKSDVKADSDRYSTGTLFATGRDVRSLDTVIDTFLEQRYKIAHNDVRSQIRDSIAPMSRTEFEKARRAGADLVEIDTTPAFLNKMRRDAELIRGIRDLLPEDRYRGMLDSELEMLEDLTRAGGKAKRADAPVYALPENMWKALQAETKNSSSALAKALGKGTDFWRNIVLHLRAPQWILNNAVGQAIFLGMAVGPMNAVHALLKTHGKGSGKIRKAIDDVASDVTSTGTEIMYHRARRGGEVPSKYQRVMDWIGDKNATIADDPYRRARFYAAAKPKIDELRAEAQAAGRTLDDADALREAAESTVWLDDVIEDTLGDMGDFRSMSAAERKYLRSVFPFYAWVRVASRVSGRHLRDKPYKMAGAQALGNAALADNEERFGALPSFIKGGIPLPDFLQNDEGTRVLSTAAFNPFMAPIDTGSALASYAGMLPLSNGGESLISQMNPFAKAMLVASTGKDPFWGEDLKDKAFLPELGFDRPMSSGLSMGLHSLFSVPQVQTIGKVRKGIAGTPGSSMYQESWKQPLLQYFGGVPVKDLNLGQARMRAMQELVNAGPASKS